MTTRNPTLQAAAPALLALLLLAPFPARAQDLKLEVAEVGRSVDLSRGGARFLTVVVEITAADPGRLRRVQPLRDDFQVVAGKSTLPCRWLRGGTTPDDPRRLRFTLGFSTPPASVRRVDLRADLPRLEGDDKLELQLTGLQTGGGEQERRGPGWAVQVNLFGQEAYTVPSLPPGGKFTSKGGPVDARVFRKQEIDKSPDQAVRLSLFSRSPELYDSMLDVSGTLLVSGGPSTPLLAALIKRDPSRSVAKPAYGPFVHGDFYFAVPPKGKPTGVLLTLHRRPQGAPRQPVVIRNLPVPSGD